MLPAAKSFLRFLIWKMLSGRVRVRNNHFTRLSMIPNVLARKVQHEPFLADIFSVAFHINQGAVIDVGVNRGQTLLRMLELAPERDYVGFEPQPLAAACVEMFIGSNNLRHCRVFPVALSDTTGPLSIGIRGVGIKALAPGTASMVKRFRPESFYDREMSIFAVRGDDILKALGVLSVALIKVDVEGAELEVLRGLTDTLINGRPVVVFEVLHHYLVGTDSPLDDELIEERMSRVESLEAHLRQARYRVLHIEGSVAVKEVNKIQPRRVNDLSSTDYVAIAEEHFSCFVSELSRIREVVLIGD
jgi:FkbM family methyltransferase